MDGKISIVFWVAFLIFAALFITVMVLYIDMLKSTSTQNEKMVGVVGGTVAGVSLATLGMTLYAFGGNPNRMMQFLYLFTFLVILPVGMITASVSANHLYGIRDAVAVKSQ